MFSAGFWLAVVGGLILARAQQLGATQATLVGAVLLGAGLLGIGAAVFRIGLQVNNPAQLMLFATGTVAAVLGVVLLASGERATVAKCMIGGGAVVIIFGLLEAADGVNDDPYQLNLFSFGCSAIWLGLFELFNATPFFTTAENQGVAIAGTLGFGLLALFAAAGGAGLRIEDWW
jgi:hypothetical protein